MLLRHRIFLAAAAAVFGIAVTLAISIYALNRSDREMRQDVAATQVRHAVYQLSLVTRDYMRYKSERARHQWEARHQSLAEDLRKLDEYSTSAHERVHISRLYKSDAATARIFAQLVNRNETLDLPSSDPRNMESYQSLLEASFALHSEMMIADASELSAHSKLQAKAVRKLGVAMTVASIVLVTLSVGTIGFRITRRMLKAAAKLKRGAEAFGGGDFNYAIPLSGNDEMTMAARAFNDMAEGLRRSQLNLEAANAGLQNEIGVRAAAEVKLQASEEQFRSLAQSANDAIISCDAQNRIIYCNTAATRIFGYANGMVGLPLDALIPERLRAAHMLALKEFLATGESHLAGRTSELLGLRKDGSEFPIDLSLARWVTSKGQFYTSVVRDITDRKQAEARLFREKELAQVTLASIADAVITTDDNGIIQFLNPVAAMLTGWSEGDALGRSFSEVFRSVNEFTRAEGADPVETVLATKRAYASAHDSILLARDGVEHLIETSAAPILTREGQTAGVVIVCHNVTETRALNAQLMHQASHDALTGLFNRAYFEEVLTKALIQARGGERFSTLLYLDLDQFKVINDSCSHLAGDELLRQIGKLVETIARKSDVVARLGGDEFGVLLSDCSVEDAQRIAFGLVEALHNFRFSWHDKIFAVTASIGLVGIDAVSVDQESVLGAADTACFIAKDRGRNQIAVFEPDNAEIIRRHGEMNWVSRITQGLQEHRFALYFQKIAHVNQSADPGEHYELLLRLMDNDGRVIPPMAFIPAAERYNLMPAIDRWVIATFFEYAARRPNQAFGDTFAINLSGTSINDPSFLAYIVTQFERTGAAPRSICFEITETAAIANLTRATEFMTALKKMGCRFSLDDFGSGLSSFGYLKHLPVDYLKIDGSFVKGILTDPVDRAMVDAINRVGHIIGIQTIAEFVDNDKALEELRHIGVDFAQGYGVHQPEPLLMIAAEARLVV